MKLKNICVVAATFLFSALAQAQSGIVLGVPAYGGSGCPAGSASVTLSPDQTQLSILFDQYIVQAPNERGARIDYKSCNLRIPVQIPNGYSLSMWSVDYRGFISAPRGTSARFNVDYFFTSNPRSQVSSFRNFVGPYEQDYQVQDNFMVQAAVWSRCGASEILGVNANLRATSNGRADVLATVDSADVNTGIIYHMQLRRCN